MLENCVIKINNNEYKAAIKSGSANSAFEKIKLEVFGDPVVIENELKKCNQIKVSFNNENWTFGFSEFKIKNNKNFEFEFEPKSINF